MADYHINGNNEQFTLDELGNRTLVNDKNNNDIEYTANDLTNRYSMVGPASLAYDDAGNLTTDEQGYDYEYDYENRIVEIKDGSTTIAQYAYDALGRRISKTVGSDTTLYYYNNNNQVLMAFDAAGAMKELNVFGNYIDEVVYSPSRFYIHDHLYSVVAVTNLGGTVLERREYDAYGLPTFYSADFANSYPVSQLTTENPYLFTGRRVDILDSGSLKLQYNRNRYYSYTLGRWLTHDPLGITPNPQLPNKFEITKQLSNNLNLYEYVKSMPLTKKDEFGLITDPSEPQDYFDFSDISTLILSLPSCPNNKCDYKCKAMKLGLKAGKWGHQGVGVENCSGNWKTTHMVNAEYGDSSPGFDPYGPAEIGVGENEQKDYWDVLASTELPCSLISWAEQFFNSLKMLGVPGDSGRQCMYNALNGNHCKRYAREVYSILSRKASEYKSRCELRMCECPKE